MCAKTLCIVSMLMSISAALAAPVQITVDCSKPTVELAPHLYGLFFEDINFAADGGLYAELVQNRSFEYYPVVRGEDPLHDSYVPLYAWEAVERGGASVELEVENNKPLNDKNTNYLKIDIQNKGQAAGIANTGFDGIPVDAGAQYDLSLYARKSNWVGSTKLTVALETEDGAVCGKIEFNGIGGEWKKLEGIITSDRTADDARLVITADGEGDLYLDMVSLFPQDTFAGRKNGMRKDLGQALKDLDPKFLRFPGGCIAHGDGLDNVYRWKDTVGDVAERKPNWNRWGYHQTYGLGYFEYFQLCEDIGATALPVIPVGVSCGFNPPQECVPMDELGPWIQDALDLIEFANGSVDTEWGKVRADMGHPEPFNLKFICLGNEPHDNALFRDRFPPFVEAIRETYPDIKIIGTSGLGPEIPIYDLMTEQKVYSSDEHYYMSPQWFFANTDRFDSFDRSKPLIFIGEYAAHDVERSNTLYSALSEAAYLTGVERNADIVDMTCYAPLFGHRYHSQWEPDLIYFDNRDVVKSANYYIQQLFACNKGDVYLSNDLTILEDEEEVQPTPAGAVGIGTWHTTIEIKDVAVNGEAVDPSAWKVESGTFEMKDGEYAQVDVETEPAISIGETVYEGDTVTYTLRARKTGGDEGFLIVFGRGKDSGTYWFNVGGWGNTQHALQYGPGNNVSIVTQTPGSIDDGKWYDIKIVMGPGTIKCHIDDELIIDHVVKQPGISIAATLDKAVGEVIVKLINPRKKAVEAGINLTGVEEVDPQGTLLIVAGDRNSENTFENPDAVKTETHTIEVGKQFQYTLPPYSAQFIRIKAN